MPAVYPLMMAMFAIVCLTKTSKLNKYSIYFWMLLYCIGTMGKFSILTPILIYLIIYDFKHRLKVKKNNKVYIVDNYISFNFAFYTYG